MKQVFTTENALEAEKYIGKKVLCYYQEDNIDGGIFRIGILEQINNGRSPFVVNVNVHKIISNFTTIAYDPDMDDTVKSINNFIHEGHCKHQIDAKDLHFFFCPVCGEKLF
jgi:hypothetical protein